MQEHCHTKLLATRYSLFAIRYSPFNFHQSPITIRIFPDLPICRPHDLPTTWLGRNFALPFLPHRLKSVATKRSPLKQAERLEGASPDAPNFSAVREHCPPDKIIRHSLPFSFC
jgi:hypothetical protein